MTTYERQSLVEMVLYILNKTKGTDIYHVFKILYFAEQKHLLEWGDKMVPDNFHAYEYGPVPDQLYKALHNNPKYGRELPEMLLGVVRFAGEDAPNVLLPNREANMDWLSRTEIACLDASISENAGLSFNALKEKSHDSAWLKAWISAQNMGDDTIDPVSMAKAAGADEGVLEYIEEQMAIDRALA